MARDNPNFSKILRNFRQHSRKSNGLSKFKKYINSGSDLILKNPYSAAQSSETINFLSDLLEVGYFKEAKLLINELFDRYPKQMSKNPKLGKLFTKLIENEHLDYSLSLLDRILLGKMPNGPSISPSTKELAANESLPTILKALAKHGRGDIAGIVLQRLAILDPNSLSNNPQLEDCVTILRKNNQDEIADTAIALTAPHAKSPITRSKSRLSRRR